MRIIKDGNLELKYTELEYINFLQLQIKMAEQMNNMSTAVKFKRELRTLAEDRIKEARKMLNKESGQLQFTINNIDRIARKMPINKKVRSQEEAVKLINSINLAKFLQLEVKENEEFICPFFLRKFEDRAYIYTINKVSRYFLKSKPKKMDNGEYDTFEKSYTLIDLYRIFFDKNYYQALEELSELFNIIIINKDTTFRKKQKEKFATNMLALSKLKDNYPYLNQLLGKHLIVLKELNLVALEYMSTVEKSIDKQAVFFYTARQMEERLHTIAKQLIKKNEELKILSYSAINRLYCTYRVLGLLTEVEKENIPILIIQDAPVLTGKKNDILYYIIPEYNTILLSKAERIAKKLKNARFSATTHGYKEVREILGDKIAGSIYKVTAKRTTIEKQKAKNGELYGQAKRIDTLKKKKEEIKIIDNIFSAPVLEINEVKPVVNANIKTEDLPF